MGTSGERNQQVAGQAALLFAAFLWSTSGLFIKLVDWHPVVLTGIRSLISAAFLLTVRFISPPKKTVKKQTFTLWAGGISYALTMLTFVVANKHTTSANAILLQYSAPVWAALLGWWLNKEKPHWEHWGALGMVFLGLFIFFKDSLGTGSLFGDGLALASGLFFAANCVFMRMMKDGDPRDILLLSHTICAVVAIPFCFLHPPVLTFSTVLPVVYMGIFQLGLASAVYAYGMKRISAVQAMLTATIEPICNPLWVFIVIGEKPTSLALIGGAVILTAVLISSIIGKQREVVKKSNE